jgi:ATP-dependent protease ClpP protease subunit
MNHQISSNPQGKLQDLKLELEEVKRIEKQCLTIMSERTGQAIKVIEKQISKGDDYIQPDRAIKEGIAHKILTLKGKLHASHK